MSDDEHNVVIHVTEYRDFRSLVTMRVFVDGDFKEHMSSVDKHTTEPYVEGFVNALRLFHPFWSIQLRDDWSIPDEVGQEKLQSQQSEVQF